MSWNSMMMAVAVAESDPRFADGEDATEVTPEDAAAIRMLVRAQLVALRGRNAVGAFDLCAPSMRERVQSADMLLDTVRAQMGDVRDFQRVYFGDLMITPEGVGQRVRFVDADGGAHRALYLVERQPDGLWLTNGCIMAERVLQAA